MIQQTIDRVKQLWLLASYREKDREIQTDESKQIAHSTYHQNLIGMAIWLASLVGINIRRTYFNNPKGDAKAEDAETAIEFASVLRERYYRYNSIDLEDLDDIEFREQRALPSQIAKKIAAKGTKRWCINSGAIAPSAKLEFEVADIRYLEFTNKQQILDYLSRNR
jgi:hypothetical protein